MTGLSIRSRAPAASSQTVRKVMVANRGVNTSPERLLQSALSRAGLTFRQNVRPIATVRCAADIVFRKHRVCIFVDGCFWHGCPRHFECPKTNASWWREKIEANRIRDRQQSALLRAAGWKVVRVWEHDINPKNVSAILNRILVQVKRPRST